MKFFIIDFFSNLRIWSDLIKKSLMENFLFWAVEVALYIYKSILWPCMDSYCYFWASAPSRFLDKLKKRVCRTVGPSLNALLERLAHHRIISRQSNFIL